MKEQKRPSSQPEVSFQEPLRPPPPDAATLGCQDYREECALFVRIDEIIRMADLDTEFIRLSLAHWDHHAAGLGDGAGPPCCPYDKDGNLKDSWVEHTRCALRVNIAAPLLKCPSVRVMSARLADSALLRWFCGLGEFGKLKAPSKSTVARYGDWLDGASLAGFIDRLNRLAAGLPADADADAGGEAGPLGLSAPIDMGEAWLDGTCLGAAIHHPVDWVLLRDVTRTLCKALILIRRNGIKNRMPQPPEEMMREMNKLCIEMGQCRRRAGAKKARKQILRTMIKLTKRVGTHARRHGDLLAAAGTSGELTPGRAAEVTGRIGDILGQLPAVVHQVRERILGGRKVASKDKVLSPYEGDIHVVVRGKAGAEVEFGNVLRISENREGVILGWRLHRDPVSDNSAAPFAAEIEHLTALGDGAISALWTDRGMDSAANVAALKAAGIANGICPKKVESLCEKMAEPGYAEGQRRRAATEGRIGILKNKILGGGVRRRGFDNREKVVGWGVLTHNLWVMARLLQPAAQEVPPARARAA